MPDDYTEPPLMDELVSFYVKAFYSMSSSRGYQVGGSPNYLGLSAVKDYIAVFGKPYCIDEFTTIIFALDAVYVPVVIKRKQSASSPSPPTAPVRR